VFWLFIVVNVLVCPAVEAFGTNGAATRAPPSAAANETAEHFQALGTQWFAKHEIELFAASYASSLWSFQVALRDEARIRTLN
jgi:hypothetical protein